MLEKNTSFSNDPPSKTAHKKHFRVYSSSKFHIFHRYRLSVGQHRISIKVTAHQYTSFDTIRKHSTTLVTKSVHTEKFAPLRDKKMCHIFHRSFSVQYETQISRVAGTCAGSIEKNRWSYEGGPRRHQSLSSDPLVDLPLKWKPGKAAYDSDTTKTMGLRTFICSRSSCFSSPTQRDCQFANKGMDCLDLRLVRHQLRSDRPIRSPAG